MFCDGFVPSTGSGVGSAGRLSAPPVVYPGCNATATPGAAPVYGGDGALSTTARAELRATFGGQPLPSSPNQCGSVANGRGTLDGYITVDTVDRCGAAAHGTLQFDAHLTARNVLIGSAMHYSNTLNSSFSVPAAPLEATAGAELELSRSFYFEPGIGLGARREPLPSAWSTEQGGAGLAGAQSDLIVWRSPPKVGTPFSCAAGFVVPAELDNKAASGRVACSTCETMAARCAASASRRCR